MQYRHAAKREQAHRIVVAGVAWSSLRTAIKLGEKKIGIGAIA